MVAETTLYRVHHGCFWHCHEGCKYFVLPKTNIEFWNNKLQSNAYRDQENYRKLEEQGWSVIVVWECEITKAVFEKTMTCVIVELTEKKNSTVQRL